MSSCLQRLAGILADNSFAVSDIVLSADPLSVAKSLGGFRRGFPFFFFFLPKEFYLKSKIQGNQNDHLGYVISVAMSYI